MNVQYTEKIESIFNHTLLLIKENGFHGTPMSQIAKQSDVAVGTIYHYFPSKEVLIVELYHYCKRQVHEYIFKDFDDNLSYRDKFEFVFCHFCDFHVQNDIIFRFMDQFYSSPYFELKNCNNDDGIYEENRILKFLKEGVEQKHIKTLEIHTLTSAFIGPAISFSKSAIYRKEKYEQSNLKELVEIIWLGIKYDNEL